MILSKLKKELQFTQDPQVWNHSFPTEPNLANKQIISSFSLSLFNRLVSRGASLIRGIMRIRKRSFTFILNPAYAQQKRYRDVALILGIAALLASCVLLACFIRQARPPQNQRTPHKPPKLDSKSISLNSTRSNQINFSVNFDNYFIMPHVLKVIQILFYWEAPFGANDGVSGLTLRMLEIQNLIRNVNWKEIFEEFLEFLLNIDKIVVWSMGPLAVEDLAEMASRHYSIRSLIE
ncbi:hypothetical protein BpHYR1_021597 [Brachionus plicatilis]|uniref:Uncharacterized protein n=1 Tax=Brachionus plicatilis TaxID=10195 RepID=A0A3M7P7M9_BRAPC|nr:hypothetical protein BpHYR1_021597 [Brachionus plicatilis]